MNGKNEHYRVLHVLEFSSERRRMGILVVDENENCFLFSKGSDDAIFRRSKRSGEYEDECQEQVENFSRLGLRTLVAAYRLVSVGSWLILTLTRFLQMN